MGEENIGSFEWAITRMKSGARMTRRGWNGKGMFTFLVDGSMFQVNRAPLNKFFPTGTEVTYRPHFDMKYADGTIGVWLASHSDMTADDWEEVE